MENKKYPPYLFDMDFDSLSLPPEPVEEEEAPPPPTFSEAELQAARDTAFEAGKAEGFTRANTGFEHQLTDVIGSLHGEFTTIARAQYAANHETMRDCVKVAATIARKMFPEYAKTHGLAEIEEFIKATISTLFSEADVIVRIPEALADEVASRLTPAAAASGLGENLKIVPDSTLGPADCRMEWGNGGAERNGNQLLSEIELTIERFIEHNEIPPMAILLDDEPVPPAATTATAPNDALQGTAAEAEILGESAVDGTDFAQEQTEPQTAETIEMPETEIAGPADTPIEQPVTDNFDMQQPNATDIPTGAPEPVEEPAIALPAIEPLGERAPEPAPTPAALPGAIDTPTSEPRN